LRRCGFARRPDWPLDELIRAHLMRVKRCGSPGARRVAERKGACENHGQDYVPGSDEPLSIRVHTMSWTGLGLSIAFTHRSNSSGDRRGLAGQRAFDPSAAYGVYFEGSSRTLPLPW